MTVDQEIAISNWLRYSIDTFLLKKNYTDILATCYNLVVNTGSTLIVEHILAFANVLQKFYRGLFLQIINKHTNACSNQNPVAK